MESLHALYDVAGQPFHDVPTAIVATIAAIYFIAFLGRGVLGFGAIAPTVVLTSLLIPPHHAVLLALVAGTLPMIQMLGEGLRDGDWHIARPIMLAVAIFIPAGVWLFAIISSDWFAMILGAVIAGLMLLDLTKWLESYAAGFDLRSQRTAFILSAISGFLNGLAGAGGVVTLALYLKHACRDHVSLRATLILISTMMMCWRLAATVAGGLVTVKIAAEAVLLTPAVYAAIWLGQRSFKSISPGGYQRLVQVVLMLSALVLFADGLRRVL